MKKTWLYTMLMAALMAFGGCDDDTDVLDGDMDDGMGSPDAGGGMGGAGTIVDIAAGDDRFETLVAAVQRVGLDSALAGEGPFTVFAPTDDAFEALGVDLADVDDATLTQILQYHVIGAEVPSTAIPTDPPVADTLANLSLWFDTSDGVMVNEATVVTADVEADNGVIHVIDSVLMPPDVPTMAGIAGLSSLVAAAAEAELVSALQGAGPFTVFAPTNDAFATFLDDLGVDGVADVPDAALSQTLLYHVVGAAVASSDIAEGTSTASALATSQYDDALTLVINRGGDAITVNQASVVIADIRTTNGIVHVVDSVITVPNVVDMVSIAGLTELGTAVGAASGDLGTVLAGDGPFTVFAPTNEAFQAIEAPTDADALRDVLLFHVGTPDAPALAGDLSNGEVPTALTEQTVTIEVDGGVTVEGASVVIPDVVVNNGVVHVVNQVLLPPSN